MMYQNMTLAQSERTSTAMAETMRRIKENGGAHNITQPVSSSDMSKALATQCSQVPPGGFPMSTEQQNRMSVALANCLMGLHVIASDPVAAQQFNDFRIMNRYMSFPDGAEAGSGQVVGGSYSPAYYQARQRLYSPDIIDADYTVIDDTKVVTSEDLGAEHRQLNTDERRPSTPQSVEQKIPTQPVGDSRLPDWVQRIIKGNNVESEATRQAKREAAQSNRTNVENAHREVLYSKDTCTSMGHSFSYNVMFEKVDWGELIKNKSSSVIESVEKLVSFITNAINKNYGGWGRITEIIVRDQHLIINRSAFCPVIDPEVIESGIFPIDTVDYIRDGALASFFDWSMLRHMRNLHVLDIDDLGFYEYNIGDRLKCGRRIGVSTLFNLCKSLDVLVLAGDEVTRESLYTEEATPVKKKLAAHKRFSLFSDGYKLEVCKNTNAFADWTFGNMKTYASNRGNKGLFRYCGGVLTRGVLALGATGVNLITHLAGGIRDAFREATTPVNPEDVGLK